MKKKLTKKYLVREYKIKDKFMHQIAKENNYCTATILYNLRKYNIPTRNRKEGIIEYLKRNNKQKKQKYCIDCDKIISPKAKRCHKCNGQRKRGEKHPEHSKRMKGRVSLLKGRKRPNLSGKKHWNWQGGKSQLSRDIHLTIRYKEWRTKIFKRDNYTCQECGQRGGDLEVHHKKRFSDTVKENSIKTINQAIKFKKLMELLYAKTVINLHLEDQKNEKNTSYQGKTYHK